MGFKSAFGQARQAAGQLRTAQWLAVVLLPVFLIAAFAVAVALREVVNSFLPDAIDSISAVGLFIGALLLIGVFAMAFFWVRTGGFGLFAVVVLLLVLAPVAGATTFFKQPNPATLPASPAVEMAWSHDNHFLVVGAQSAGTPRITIYEQLAGVFTKLTDPAIMPTGAVTGLDFSPDDSYLAVAHATTPFITIYSITGTTFTKVANPDVLPGANGNGVEWSHDGLILAEGFDTLPGTAFFRFNGTGAGTTFNRLATPNGDTCRHPAWSEDDALVVTVACGSGGALTWQRSGFTITLLGNGIPAGATSSVRAEWFGDRLAVLKSSATRLIFYDRAGTIFSPVTPSVSEDANGASGMSWSPDGVFLGVVTGQTDGLFLYGYNGESFTRLPGPDVDPAGAESRIEWSDDASYFAVTSASTPFVQIYNSTFVNVTPTAPAGLSALVSLAHDGAHALIDLRWPVSSNDPDQVSGEWDYRIFLNGVFIGADTVTGADSDGVRFNVVDFTGATVANFWIVARNPAGFLDSPPSCSVSVDDRVQGDFDACGQGAPLGSGTVVPGDTAQGLKGSCEALMGASTGSLFLCGLIFVVVAFLALAAGFAVVTRSQGGMAPMIAGSVAGFGVAIFNVFAGVWGLVWGIVLIILVAAIITFFVRRFFAGGSAASGE